MTGFIILLEFLCGSLMFSYWLGLAAGKDITVIGDGNPGAFNLWHAAGCKLGIAGIFLDFMKGYFPLIFFIQSGIIKGNLIIPVAIAPILGHAFSPFLKFRGGKTIAVTFGVWSALTQFEISITYAVILAFSLLFAKLIYHGKALSTETDAFMDTLGMLLLVVYLTIRNFYLYLIVVSILNFLILVFKNRGKLFKRFKVDKKHLTSISRQKNIWSDQ